MPEDRIDPQPRKDENVERTENTEPGTNGERFQSDTQKIVRRHLENEDDIITHDDIANVRVGMTPPDLDAPTEVRFEDEEAKEEVEEEYLGDNDDLKEGENAKDDRITPWDTIDPS